MRKRIGNYEIIEEVGRGGMAVVYKALHTSLERIVAIKELHSSLKDDRELVERFKREAKAAASLNHPNIVQVYDFWNDRNTYYLAMEYVDGVDLKTVLERCGRLPLEIALIIAIQISDAVDFAHQRKIVHRDIKTGNIIVSKKGIVKLADFGIAHIMDTTGSHLTQAGIVLGTPAYMSPEQVRGDKLTEASDIFSFGIVMYEMLTGKKPFVEDTDEKVIYKILTKKPVPPRRLNTEIPFGLQRIISRCLQKKQHKRYKSMAEVRDALARHAATKKQRYEDVLKEYIDFSLFKRPLKSQTAPWERKGIKLLIAQPVKAAAVIAFGIIMLILYFSLTVKVKNEKAVETDANKAIEKRETAPLPQQQPKDESVKATDKKIEAPVQKPVPEKQDEVKKEESPVEEKKTGPTVIDKLKDMAGIGAEQKQEAPAGGIKVLAYPWAKIYIDGEYVETTPTSKIIKLPVGEHKITFSHPNFPSVTRKVNIKENETREIVVRLEPKVEKR